MVFANVAFYVDVLIQNKTAKNTLKPSLVIGNGHFRKEFEVREGMEEEASALRRE